MNAYQIIAYQKDARVAVNVFKSDRTTQIIVGLKQGKDYTFKVSAKNNVAGVSTPPALPR